jgi:membrane-bound metal-dependent hydrolase YbcI (DUF457 family)
MPNAGTHAVVGTATGIVTWIACQRRKGEAIRFGGLAVGAAAGLLGGLAADLIEPATSPNHRRFAHSMAAAAALAIMLYVSLHCFDDEKASAFACLVFAYLSHLLLDAHTPIGLPIY